MTAIPLTLLFFVLAQSQATPAVVSGDPTSHLDKEFSSKYCSIRYTDDQQMDARQLAEDADTSLTAMAGKLAPLDPTLMDNFRCTIFQFATPQPGRADDGTANSRTADRGRWIEVSILAPSSFSSTSRTIIGERKGDDYVYNIVANELSTVLFERVTRDKGKGWYFHEAPQWFVQGIEGYFGLMYSSVYEREITLPKYIAAARNRSGEVAFDDSGVRVGNPYLGGLVFVAFLYDAYGAKRVNSLLSSPAGTFDEAFAATFGDWKSVEAKYREWITNSASSQPSTP